MSYKEPENEVKIEEIDLEEISEIIGFNEDDSTGFSSPLIDEQQEEELESRITQHGFALNPLTKLMVVGGGMLIVVAILALIWNGMQGNGGYTATKKGVDKKEEELKISSEEIELGRLKADLALNQQKEEMEKLKIKNELPPPPKPLENQPKPVVQEQAPPPPKPLPTVERTKKPLPPKREQAPPPPLPPPLPPPKPEIDPYTLWTELSLIGSYGGSIAIANVEGVNNVGSINNNERLIASKNIANGTQLENNTLNISKNIIASSPENSVKSNQIKLNQVVKGNLATPLIWYSDDKEEELPPAIITLSEAIVTQQGKEIFPADSILIADVNPYNKNGGLVELEVKEVRLPDGKIQSIPKNSIVINRDNGKPLIALLKQEGGNDGGGGIDTNTILDGASIVSDFMDIPGARSLHLLRRRDNSYRRNRNEITYFWYLPENIKVSIRVIKPFSIKTEIETETETEEPMELDLEGINLNFRSTEFICRYNS